MYEDLVKRLRMQADVEKFYSGEPMLYDKAADAIEELQQIAGHYEETAKDYFKDVCYYLERMPKWIPVTERLPDFEGSLLCMRKTAFGLWVQEVLYYEDGEFSFNGIYILKDGAVTHWMPLPEPPKEGGE